ncbi:MAG: Spi family protease inhibitor [Prolixibacteraceae bacterium]|nr:Spi family protease inhibitor [Prolixibacteraceae bacterium]
MAANFLASQVGNLKSISISDLSLAELNLSGENRFNRLKSSNLESNKLVYLFKTNTDGFVLVAGDDLAKPILGYSTSAKINEDNLPINMLKWTEEYKRQIRYLKKHPELKSSGLDSKWSILENEGALAKASPTSVAPLMTTTWNQSPYYNDLCPQKYSCS